MALRLARRVVHGKHGVARVARKEAVVHHLHGATEAFFGGLEDEVERAREAAVIGQLLGRREQHRRVAVVPAGMHQAVVATRVGLAAFFDDGQRVHVGADAQRALAAAATQRADDARATEADVDLIAHGAQLVGHQRAGAVFLEADLGVAVDVSPDGYEFSAVRQAAFDDFAHGACSAAVCRRCYGSALAG